MKNLNTIKQVALYTLAFIALFLPALQSINVLMFIVGFAVVDKLYN